jgi:general secretion pathway protein A
LNQLLIQFLSEGTNAALIIDEAQNLSIPVLEQIRMLSNLETEKEKMLQIVLLGQLELDEKLRSPELKQLNQRIAIRHHLLPLNREETESYVHQRLIVAGSHGSITFSKSALDKIYLLTQGTPRLINLLCDRALIGGFVEETFHIDKNIIERAEKEVGGEEWGAPALRPTILAKYFPPLRIFLLAILLFLLTGMILLNHDRSPSLQGTRLFIHDQFEKIYLRISGETRPSLSPNPRSNQKKTMEEMVKTYPEETR